MPICRNCGTEVFLQDVLTGVCSSCGQSVTDLDTRDDVENGGAAANQEFEDSSSPQQALEIRDQAPAVRIEAPSDEQGTVDEQELNRTINEPLPAEPPMPASPDINQTIVDRVGSQTIDVTDEIQAAFTQADLVPEDANGNIGGTTVADFIDLQSVDSNQKNTPPHVDAQPPAAGQPIDPSIPVGNQTIEIRPGAQTFEVTPESIQAIAQAKPGTVADGVVDATLDSAKLSQDIVDRLKQTWNRTVNERGATINTSLKSDFESEEQSQPTLHIQPRSFRASDAGEIDPTDYDLLNLLGEGGMGMVYAARQASVDRTVAIKMLKPETAQDQSQRNKFLSEAAVTGELEHPNIVPIYDLGSNPDGALFYAMKRVQGTPWDKVIGEKSLHENIEILMKVCDAVAFAHSRGVIHRDLKPENIMLGGFGEVLVMDWGLAVPVDRRPIAGVRLQVSMGGTPAYMSPEMATGPFDRIGIASDIYLLGAILYEIVTGRTPHTGRDVMKCLFAAARNQIEPTDKSGELVEIAMTAMATDPEDRHESVQFLQDAIRQYLSHSESISIAALAAESLAKANKSDDYQDYSQAMFGFQQAIELWDGNERAKGSLIESKMAYAQSAYTRGDFDLGASLLDEQIPEQVLLLESIRRAKAEVDARQQRLKSYKRAGIVAAAFFFCVVSGAAIWINFEKAEAERQKEIAEVQRAKAVQEEEKAKSEERKARFARDEERKAKDEAVAAKLRAEQEEAKAKLARDAERDAKEDALVAKLKAEAEERKAKLAEEEERKAKVAAVDAQKKAENEERKAKLAQEEERKATLAAVAARKKAEAEEIKAKLAREEERKAKLAAVDAQKKAEEEERKAKLAREEERIAKLAAIEAKEREAYEAYVARIGAAAAKIDEHGYERARALLRECVPEAGEKDYRNWEWGRLWFLCNRHKEELSLDAPAECVAYHPNGTQIISGQWGGKAVVWSTDGEKIAEIDAGGSKIHAVAYSPDGKFVAIGGDQPSGFVKIFDAATGKLKLNLLDQDGNGHRRPVLSVEFSSNGKLLLTGSMDGAAKIWNVESGKVIRTLRGHRGWVWDAKFCPKVDVDAKLPGASKIVTVSQDNMAIVWVDATGEWNNDDNLKRTPRFRGHEGPVYAAAFSADGKTIATAGHDKRVLLWTIADLEEFDYRAATDEFIEALEKDTVLEQSSVSVPQYRALHGHKASIRSLTFSTANRDLLVSSGHDNTVKIWNAHSGNLVKTLRGHGEWVRGCAISPDGKLVASASYDQKVFVWDIDGYQEFRVLQGRILEGHEDSILEASFSPDSRQVVTASRDRTIKTWDSSTGREQRSFREGHAFLASHAVYFADGTKMITTAVDNSARVWDVATGTQKQILENTGRNAAVAVSGDGRWILTGGTQHVDDNGSRIWLANIWNSNDGTVAHALKAHKLPVSAVAISPSGDLAYTGDASGVGFLWQLETGELIRKLDWHGAKIISAAFVDDKRLVTAAMERTVAQWDVAVGKIDESIILKHPDIVTSMAFRPGHGQVLTSCKDGQVRLWNLNTATIASTLAPDKNERFGAVKQVAVSPDGGICLTANSDDRVVRLFNLESGREVIYPFAQNQTGPFLQLSSRNLLWSANFSHDGKHVITVGGDQAQLWAVDEKVDQRRRRRMSFSPHGIVASASFSNDGKAIVSGSWDGSAKIWVAKTGEAIIKLEGQHSRAVNCAAFSPVEGSNLVLTAGDDATVILWRIDWTAKTAEPVTTFKGHKGPVLWATFSVDGKRILSASEDKTARIWDTADPSKFRELTGHHGAVVRAAFSQNSKWIITGSDDNTARIWNAVEMIDEQSGEAIGIGEKTLILRGHTATVSSVAFSPDGLRALTGSEDYTAKLWDAMSGKELLTLKGHEQEVSSVAFSSKSSDGRYALTASHDGTAIIWLAAPWNEEILLGKKQ